MINMLDFSLRFLQLTRIAFWFPERWLLRPTVRTAMGTREHCAIWTRSSRVMIFGESAGGESVKQLLANPPSPLPFSSAILESQNAVFPGNGLQNYKQVLLHFGCANVDCLRKIPAVYIKAYIESESLSFPPVNNDGTSTADVRLSISTGKLTNVPTMLGSKSERSTCLPGRGWFNRRHHRCEQLLRSIQHHVESSARLHHRCICFARYH